MVLSLRTQRIALICILIFGLLLRLKGLHNPIIDHPGWRQGDEAAIARNFAFVDPNIFRPQADYNGPGPNYVELELQIVPWIASLGYRLFGVHEIFGRLISIAFSLGTVGVLFCFGRWLFSNALAGLGAALLYAIAPGAIYYGRTFQPDTAMAFFLTCALFIGTRSLLEDEEREWKGALGATALLLMAMLAKSVSALMYLPLIAVAARRYSVIGALSRPQLWLMLMGSMVPYVIYDEQLRSVASWRWASGITTVHVIPELIHALLSPALFWQKLGYSADAITMLAHTMLGPVIFTLLIFGFLTPIRSRSGVLLYGWLAAACMYLFVVVTVERVDYYLFPFVPLAALVGGAYLSAALGSTNWALSRPAVRNTALASLLIALLITVVQARNEIDKYYEFNHSLVRECAILNFLLPPDALVVVGHLDPSVLYYINRRGWQEDAYLWTPFDEESAIRKGARYFVVVEPDRLVRNIELSAWLKRFPLMKTPLHTWPVYITDPDLMVPGAEAAWRKFRAHERLGQHTHGRHKTKHHSRVPASIVPDGAEMPLNDELMPTPAATTQSTAPSRQEGTGEVDVTAPPLAPGGLGVPGDSNQEVPLPVKHSHAHHPHAKPTSTTSDDGPPPELSTPLAPLAPDAQSMPTPRAAASHEADTTPAPSAKPKHPATPKPHHSTAPKPHKSSSPYDDGTLNAPLATPAPLSL